VDPSPWLFLALLLVLLLSLLLLAEAGSTSTIHAQSCVTRGYAESFGLMRLHLCSAAV
jgi:DMSO/TMAO reductase YedYZ molybdopterin-dependent catalytic subunit